VTLRSGTNIPNVLKKINKQAYVLRLFVWSLQVKVRITTPRPKVNSQYVLQNYGKVQILKHINKYVKSILESN
jgi:hypothetical protein